MIMITKNKTLSIFGENQNNATLVQKFIYCEKNIHMEVLTTIVVPQVQLRVKRTPALFAEHICWIVDRCYDEVIGSSGVSNDVIGFHIHNIYLIFPSG